VAGPVAVQEGGGAESRLLDYCVYHALSGQSNQSFDKGATGRSKGRRPRKSGRYALRWSTACCTEGRKQALTGVRNAAASLMLNFARPGAERRLCVRCSQPYPARDAIMAAVLYAADCIPTWVSASDLNGDGKMGMAVCSGRSAAMRVVSLSLTARSQRDNGSGVCDPIEGAVSLHRLSWADRCPTGGPCKPRTGWVMSATSPVVVQSHTT
jgi:hypothetical protein